MEPEGRKSQVPGGPPGQGQDQAPPQQQDVDRNNVQEMVTITMTHAVLAINPENSKRITQYARVQWPQECSDPELRDKPWESRWARFNGVQTRAQLDAKNKLHVTKTFVKLLIAEYKLNRQVNYAPTALGNKRRSMNTAAAAPAGDGAGPSEPPRKASRTSVVMAEGRTTVPKPHVQLQANQLADDLAIVARRFSQEPPSSPTRQQQRVLPVPTILRNTDGPQLDYLGPAFRLTDGMAPQDLGTDFQHLRQMINSLNPLLPPVNFYDHPLYMFQGKMSVALELVKTKCTTIAAAHEQARRLQVQPSTDINFGPRLAQMESNVMEAVLGLQEMIQNQPHHDHTHGGHGTGASNRDFGGGAHETSDLRRECEKLREENQKHLQALQSERARSQELEKSLDQERQRATRNVKLERLNHLEAAGFLVNDKIDPPPATLEAQDLIVMNKPSQYWTEFDQGRWDDLTNDQKREMMCGWDPTDAACPHPAWASFDKLCPICSTVIGPEGGYSTGTCVSCIYHPGCLQALLLSATRLECASCGVPFNLRLWQAFKCTNLYIDLLPNFGPGGVELPKRTPDTTDDEFTKWHAKQNALILAHTELLRVIVPNRNRMSDVQFRDSMNNLSNYVNRHAETWGLVKREWIEDVVQNIRQICLPGVDGMNMPLFPEMVEESGYANHPLWPRSFWRSTRGDPGAGPSNANP